MVEINNLEIFGMMRNLDSFCSDLISYRSVENYQAVKDYEALIISTREDIRIRASNFDSESRKIIEDYLESHIKLSQTLDIWVGEK